MRRVAAATALALVTVGVPARAQPAAPTLPGYALSSVGGSVPSAGITQLAFDPSDPGHLYAAQVAGMVTRYDYDAASGSLSAAVVVAAGLGTTLGLAFHSGELYVSHVVGPADGRLSRLRAPDAAGVFQVREDFVHAIPVGQHLMNQLGITGDSLYVGIGAVGRTGDPAEENLYTMTVARIADLTQVNFGGPANPDFTLPVNHLGSPAEWLDSAAGGGLLRYHASGFRNPYGLALDGDGDLWVSSNGNNDPGFTSPDWLYRKLPLGAQGAFPPASFGFGPPHITGTPVPPFVDLGISPSPTGMAFVPAGPDRGKLLMAQAGAGDQVQFPVGRDVLRVDPVSGDFEIAVDHLDLPTDVVQDPFGRLLVADYGDGAVYLLTPPEPLLALTATDIVGHAAVDAVAFDVVRGDVGALLSGNGDYQTATQTCLADDVPVPVLPHGSDPAAGNAHWYLMRKITAAGPGSYDGGFPSQPLSRDPGIAAAAAACP